MFGCPSQCQRSPGLLPPLVVGIWFVAKLSLCNCLASASLWDCGTQEGGNRGCLAYEQIPRPCIPKRSVNVCGLVEGWGWVAGGSREMKTGFSALPLNAGELKGPQNEGMGPGDLSVNTDGLSGRSEHRYLRPGLHPNVEGDGAPSSDQAWAQDRPCMSLAQAESWQGAQVSSTEPWAPGRCAGGRKQGRELSPAHLGLHCLCRSLRCS